MDDAHEQRLASLYKEYLLTYLPSQGDSRDFAEHPDSEVHRVHCLHLRYDRPSKDDARLTFSDWWQAYRKGFENFKRHLKGSAANLEASPRDSQSAYNDQHVSMV